jgi:hypothetical protein
MVMKPINRAPMTPANRVAKPRIRAKKPITTISVMWTYAIR